MPSNPCKTPGPPEPAHCSSASWGLSLACQEVSPLCLQRPQYLCYLFLINSLLSEILCLDILLQLVLRLPRQRCLPVGLRPQVLGETGGSACDVGARVRAGKCGCRHEPGHRGHGTRVPGLVTSLAGEEGCWGGVGPCTLCWAPRRALAPLPGAPAPTEGPAQHRGPGRHQLEGHEDPGSGSHALQAPSVSPPEPKPWCVPRTRRDAWPTVSLLPRTQQDHRDTKSWV